MVGARPTNPLAASFRPFIPPSVRLPELTPLPLIIGTLLGIVFGASSLYLVLKVGLTVSASIPVAVISITIFRLLSKFGLQDANILQNNIVQTAGSAGESIAFGLGVTMPAIMILGFDLEIARVMLVAILGGLLGILMMIPLRRALIVDQHGLLKYPEGTACAEVLKAAASRESLAVADHTHTTTDAEIVNEEAAGGGKVIFSGFGIGLLYQAAMGAFKLWKDTPEKIFAAPFKAGSISAEISPALVGSGLHYRAAHCLDHVCRRCARLPGSDPGNQIFRRTYYRRDRSRHHADQRHDSERYPERLHSLYWRRGRCRRRHYQLVSVVTHHLARFARRFGRFARGPPCDFTGSSDRSRYLDEDRDRRRRFTPSGDDRSPPAQSAMEPARRSPDRRLWFSVRNRFLPPNRRDRLVIQSDLRHDRGHPPSYLSDFSYRGLDRPALLRNRALDWRNRLHRSLQRRHHFTGPENRVPGRIDSEISTNRDPVWRSGFRHRPGSDSFDAEQRFNRLCAGHDLCPHFETDGGAGGRAVTTVRRKVAAAGQQHVPIASRQRRRARSRFGSGRLSG